MVLGLPAQPVPPRGGLVHRPAQARGVGGLGCEHLPAREGGLDLLLRCAFDQPPPSARAEAEQQQGGPGVGQGRDTVSLGVTLSGVQTLEAADVEEEIERPQVCRRQPRHVADDVAEPGCASALRLCRLDRGRYTPELARRCLLPPPLRTAPRV